MRAIVARAVKRRHGRMWVEPRPGKGCAFFFTLPAPTYATATPGETR